MNNSNIAEQEDLIKESLFTLVKKHIPSAQFSDIDEIVLSYVVSILEDLGSEIDVQVGLLFIIRIISKHLFTCLMECHIFKFFKFTITP